MPEETSQGVEVRLATLEKHNRWLRSLCIIELVILVLVVMASIYMSRSGAPAGPGIVWPSTVRAHKFALLNRDGSVRATLSVAKDRGSLELYDAKGNVIWSAPGPAASPETPAAPGTPTRTP
jgi:hypothetical protein